MASPLDWTWYRNLTDWSAMPGGQFATAAYATTSVPFGWVSSGGTVTPLSGVYYKRAIGRYAAGGLQWPADSDAVLVTENLQQTGPGTFASFAPTYLRLVTVPGIGNEGELFLFVTTIGTFDTEPQCGTILYASRDGGLTWEEQSV